MPQEIHETPAQAGNTTSGTEQAPGIGSYAGTLAAVGIGAALIEAELIPGILIGAGAMLVPNLLPKLARVFRPALKGAVRAGYKVASATRETVAEASEQFQDVVAEVRAEEHVPEPAAPAPVTAEPHVTAEPTNGESHAEAAKRGKRQPS